jgi:hypothetical protein
VCSPRGRDVSVVLRALRLLTSGIVSRDCARVVVSLPLGGLSAHHADLLAHPPLSARTAGAAVRVANRFGDGSPGVRHPAGVVRPLAVRWAHGGWR